MVPQTNKELYETAVGKLDDVGISGEVNRSIRSDYYWYGNANQSNATAPRSRCKQRRGPTERGWTQNPISYHILQWKHPPLMLCFFHLPNKYEEEEDRHKISSRTHKWGHNQQNLSILG